MPRLNKHTIKLTMSLSDLLVNIHFFFNSPDYNKTIC